MENMAQVHIEMHMRYASLSTHKKHRRAFYKTFYQMIGPGKILRECGCVTENIEEKDPPLRRPFADHVDIFAERNILVRFIDRRMRIAFDIVINADFLVTDERFEIIPVPVVISRPCFGKIADDQRYLRLKKIAAEIFPGNRIDS